MRLSKWLYIIVGVALFAALALSVVSYLDLCSEECKAGHSWTLFGLPFGPIGIVYFGLFLLLYALSWKYPALRLFVALGTAGAMGAELVLIYIQKYKIGHWCPVCLGIATSIGIAALLQIGDTMKHLALSLGVFAMGFLTLFVGVGHENKLHAMESSLKDKMAFGDLDSPIQLFLFTDWACPACRALEPKLMKLLPAIIQKGRFTFVDIAVHPETLNYSPFNLSFMINNKDKYLELRDALTLLSIETGSPTDEQIEALAKEHQTIFKELNYADVALGLKYWKDLARQFDIDGTPILVIVNPKAKKGKKLAGLQEISESNILRAIDSLK